MIETRVWKPEISKMKKMRTVATNRIFTQVWKKKERFKIFKNKKNQKNSFVFVFLLSQSKRASIKIKTKDLQKRSKSELVHAVHAEWLNRWDQLMNVNFTLFFKSSRDIEIPKCHIKIDLWDLLEILGLRFIEV